MPLKQSLFILAICKPCSISSRLIAVTLLVLLLGVLTFPSVTLAQNSDVTIAIENYTIEFGQPVDIPIHLLAGDQVIGAVTIAVSYDESVLGLPACVVNEVLSGFCNTKTPGRILLSGINFVGVSGDLVFATMAFEAIGSPNDTTALSISVTTLADRDGKPLDYSAANGLATIAESPTLNNPPKVTNPGNQTSEIGDEILLDIIATDVDEEDILSYSVLGLPANLTVTAETGQITGVAAVQGANFVTVTVNDGNGGKDEEKFEWTIINSSNISPTITNPGDQTNIVGDEVTLPIVASDPDQGDVLTFSARNLPGGLELDSQTGVITGTIVESGVKTVMISVDDGGNGQDSISFLWTIASLPNTPPTITNPGDQANTVGDSVSLILNATDGNVDDTLVYNVQNLPPGLALNGLTGQITGTVTVTGTSIVTVVVSDGREGSDNASFVWTVEDANSPPELTALDNQTSTIGAAISLQVTAIDPDPDDILTFDATGLPTGLVIITSTGEITGTATQTGAFPVLVSVIDDRGSGSNFTFFWKVIEPPNSLPNLAAPGNQTNFVDDEVTLILQATDSDEGDVLTFDAENLPVGLSLNRQTGLITGTVTVSKTSTVSVAVTDGRGEPDAVTFTWTVQARPVSPPSIISLEAQSGNAGDSVMLVISAIDDNTSTLIYTSDNLPTGLTMNPNTGEIQGVPTAAGTYDVTITATNENELSDTVSFIWTISQPPVDDPTDPPTNEPTDPPTNEPTDPPTGNPADDPTDDPDGQAPAGTDDSIFLPVVSN